MKIKPFEIWRKNLEEIETHLFQNSTDKLLCAIFFWNIDGAMQKQHYSSNFLTKPQRFFFEIFQLIWRLLIRWEFKLEILSNFCGLLRKPELYHYYFLPLIQVSVDICKSMVISLIFTTLKNAMLKKQSNENNCMINGCKPSNWLIGIYWHFYTLISMRRFSADFLLVARPIFNMS